MGLTEEQLNASIARSVKIMVKSGVEENEALAIATNLVNVGIEKCLNRQEKIRAEQDQAIFRAYEGLVH